MSTDEQLLEAGKKFGYDVEAGHRHNPQAGYGVEDIEAVEAEWTDGRDEPQFAWLFKLKDGRYVAASGGHDYTGWDCQSGLGSSIHPTREEAIRLGFTLNDRCNLGLLLPGESIPPEEPAP